MSYFDGIKVGDCVWSCVYGFGLIEMVDSAEKKCIWPINVVFEEVGDIWFTLDGKQDKNQLQTLFWDEVKITPPPKPKRMVKREAEVMFFPASDPAQLRMRHKSGDIIPDKCDSAKLTWEEAET